MSTANLSTVEFTETGAVYQPGNGYTIRYRRVNSIFFHAQTPDAVVLALESARIRRQRVRIFYGDTQTGRDWLEEHGVEGTIGNSMGPLRVPLLIHNRRSMGGPAPLDHCIVKIKLTSGGILYRHPKYHTGSFAIRELGQSDVVQGENLQDHGYTHAVDADGQNHANFKSLAKAEMYVRRMTT